MKQPAKNRPAPPPAVPAEPVRALTGGDDWKLWVVAFAVALVAYWPALNGGFIWDDNGHITRPDLRSLGGLFRIWFEIGATQQYYPVLHSFFWLEHFVFGDVATGYRVVNVLLHATAACLFATVLRRLSIPGAWFAAFLFLLHPVCVESVAWISEQKNTLSLLFYLLAALAYLHFDRSRRPVHYALATGLFLLALGSKTVTASLPAALLVIFWWQRGRLDLRRDIAPLAPWLGLAAGAGVLTAWVEHVYVNEGVDDFDLSLHQRGLLASRAIWFYLGKLLYPADLMFIYPRWEIDPAVWWQYLFPVGILSVAFAAWRWRRHRGPIAAGLFFAGSLFPALGFVHVYPFAFSFVADHFQYLASLGIFALAGAGFAWLRVRWPAAPASAALLALLTVLGALTWRQTPIYRDNITLYQATLAKNPEAAMVHHNLAQELIDLGRPTEAIPHLEAAIRLRPQSVKAAYNFGRALLGLRDFAGAVLRYEETVRLDPTHAFARNDLGFALMNLGRMEEAEVQFERAVQLKPDHAVAHFNLGRLLARRGDHLNAIKHLATAAGLRPGSVETEFALAVSLMALERVAESLVHFERAAKLAPDRADIQNVFVRAQTIGDRLNQTIDGYRAALAIDPRSAEAHFNLGEALRKAGQAEASAQHLAEAARLGWKK